MTRTFITALSITMAASFSSVTLAAGMQDQLDNIFNQMENYTAPGAYETQRRSAYFGGRYTMKNAIYNENLVAMQLPSARGGCGGIDIFGGSFSFINSDQLVQLLRQVASNAQGYAFQLAMDNMCPNCMEWMNELQIKMQGLNENMSNSCQLAQGLVNDTVNLVAHKKREETDQSLMGSLKGFGEDFLDLSQHVTTADTAVKRIFDADPAEFNEQTGADVYKALMRNSAQSWFVGGDQELIEAIMSMTGSIVVGTKALINLFIAEITSARDKIHNEYKVLTGRYGAISEIESHYNALMENVQKPKYISAGNQAGDKTDS